MRRIARSICLVALALLMAGSANAQNGDIRWYAVELLAVDQRGAVADDGEAWPVAPPLPTVDHRLVAPPDSRAIAGFRSLADGDRELTSIRRKLDAAAGYEVVTHIGWRQPGLAQDAAPAVVLPRDWRPPRGAALPRGTGASALKADALKLGSVATARYEVRPFNPFAAIPEKTELFGTVRVYRQRDLHLELDLRFLPDGWRATMAAPVELQASAENTANGDPTARTATPLSYVLHQNRRLRSNEIHYLDHPILAVVATIRPVATPNDAARPE